MNVQLPDPMRRVRLVIILSLAVWSASFAAYGMPPAPEKYRRFIVHNTDRRSLPETVLNTVGLSANEVGRSFALVAGVDTYPKLRGEERFLAPAATDIDRLVLFLRNRQHYDEIVVLRNEAVTDDNLKYFLQVYFPERFRSFPRSRFLFAYSGHGIQAGTRGYLLQSNAESMDDKANSISLEIVRTLYQEIVDSTYQSLALINACHSGAFLQRSFSGPRNVTVTEPGAHAITAAGTRELAWQVDRVGPGSLFFEKFFTGVDGRADTLPIQADGTAGDGIVTEAELWAYLSAEIELEHGQKQNPRESDFSRDGSTGGLFFVTGARKRIRAVLPPKVIGQEGRRFSPTDKWIPLKAKGLSKTVFGRSESQLVDGCNNDSAKDCLDLGLIYEFDSDLALQLYERACHGGEVTGCLVLGRRLQNRSDDALELDWARKRCERGEIKSCLQLLSYEKMIKDDRPDLAPFLRYIALATDYFQRGCDQSDAESCLKIGIATMIGEGGIKADREKAKQLFRKGCDRGVGEACVHLANLYEFENRPPATVTALYQKACDQECGEGCFRLGVFYWHGDRGLRSDPSKAQALFEMACDLWSASGCWWAAQPYLDRTGTVAEPEKAALFLEFACDRGIETACHTLGEWYEKGDRGVVQNFATAAFYYQKACSQSELMFSLSCARVRDSLKRFNETQRSTR